MTTQQSSPYRHVTTTRAEAWWIEMSRKSLYHFIWYASGKRPPPHMAKWIETLLTTNRINIIAPRGGAKTTYAVYTLAWLIGKDPFATHFIGSVSAKQSEDRLEMVREIVDTNIRFRNVFPHIHIDYKRTCNKSEFTVWSSEYDQDYAAYRTKVGFYGDQKNPTVFACGVGSSALIGRRISGLCLIDDIHSEANSATPALRQKVADWFNRTLMGCLKERAKVLVICTRWGLDDHSGRLKDLKDSEGNRIWSTIDIPAIDKDGNSYWPEVFPIERLNQIRDEIGLIMFGLMFMNDPTTLSTGQWTLDMFYRGLPDPLPDDLEVLISTDLAFTTKTASDYCVFAAIGKARNKHNPRLTDLYLLDMKREKYKFHDAIDELVAFCHITNSRWPLQKVLFENQAMTLNSYEEFVARESGYSSSLVNAPGDKGTRLSELALKSQRGGFYINQEIACLPAMISEFIGYPRVDHDDTIDAVGLPIFYWNVGDVRAGIVYLSVAIPETERSPLYF